MLRILLVLAAGLTTLLAAAVLAFWLLFDPNDYRDRIGVLAKEATGRTLTIEGDLRISLLPWLGLTLDRVSLGNAPGFEAQPFARADHIDLHIKLLPLFRKELEIGVVRLKGFELNLARNAQGVTNWADLQARLVSSEKPAQPAAGGQTFELRALAIGGLRVEAARVVWDDEQAGRRFQVSPFNMHTGDITPATPFPVHMDFEAAGNAPAVQLKVVAESTATLDPAHKRYSLKSIALDAQAQGEAVPGSPQSARLGADIDLDLAQQRLTVAGLRLDALGMGVQGEAAGEQILDAPVIKGRLSATDINPRAVLAKLGKAVPATTDPGVLAHAALDATFELSGEALRITRLTAKLDQSALAGTLARDLATGQSGFDLALDQIDVDRYLSPPAPPATPAPPRPTAPQGKPLAALQDLNLDGHLAVGNLKVKNLKIAALDLKLRTKDGVLNADPVRTRLYDGTLAGRMQLDARGQVPVLQIEQKLSGVAVNPLLKDLLNSDLLAGKATVTANVTATGLDADKILASLNGTAALSIVDGALKGVNIAHKVREAYARLKQQPAPPEAPQQTDFAELTGTFALTNGVVRNTDLKTAAPLLRLTGEGSADLNARTLDYLLKAALVGTLEGQGGKDIAELKNLTIPVRIKGSFSDPKFSLDIDSLFSARFKQQLEAGKEKLKQQVEQKREEVKQEAEQKIELEREKAKQKLEKGAQRELKKLLNLE